ncbi:MAG: hypothetical protein ACR2NB_05570, partial [Solirubrobacteraceae bacterium]
MRPRGSSATGAPDPPDGSAQRRLFHRAGPPGDVLVRGAHVLDPRGRVNTHPALLVRDGETGELGAGGGPET